MAFAVRSLSPVIITTRMPIFCSSRDGLRAVFLDDVRHGDHAEQLAVTAEQAAAFCPASASFSACPCDLRRDACTGPADEAYVAAAEGFDRRAAPSGRCRAAPGNRPHLPRCTFCSCACSKIAFASGCSLLRFQRTAPASQQFVSADAVRREHIRHASARRS